MINFYHRFLSNITNTQTSLQEVIKGQKKGSQILVDWIPDRKTIFKKLKDELANATFSNPSAQFAVQTDASDTIRCNPMQSKLFCNNGKVKVGDH